MHAALQLSKIDSISASASHASSVYINFNEYTDERIYICLLTFLWITWQKIDSHIFLAYSVTGFDLVILLSNYNITTKPQILNYISLMSTIEKYEKLLIVYISFSAVNEMKVGKAPVEFEERRCGLTVLE